MSSQLDNTSAILGEYMLKGWTLTDLHCETCRVTPLMREPSAAAAREGREPVQFCALCDGGPSGRISQAAATGAGAAPVASTSSSAQPSSAEASTDRPCQPLRSDDSGDDAASQISALLLQGYSLLNENCPQATCARVPLVGFPRKKDGAKDGRRLCVSCGGRWVSERDTAGMKLVPASSASSSSSALQPGPSEREQTKSRADDFAAEAEKSRARLSGGNPESPRSRTIRELYEAGSMMNTRKEEKVGQPVSTKPLDLETDDVEDLETVTGPSQNQSHPRGESQQTSSALKNALSATTDSLALTLNRLAQSLAKHTSGSSHDDESRYFVDIKLHTEAIKDVLAVITSVEDVKHRSL